MLHLHTHVRTAKYAIVQKIIICIAYNITLLYTDKIQEINYF